jgi:hypothetical protein
MEDLTLVRLLLRALWLKMHEPSPVTNPFPLLSPAEIMRIGEEERARHGRLRSSVDTRLYGTGPIPAWVGEERWSDFLREERSR